LNEVAHGAERPFLEFRRILEVSREESRDLMGATTTWSSCALAVIYKQWEELMLWQVPVFWYQIALCLTTV
jgi:hypothetical protein